MNFIAMSHHHVPVHVPTPLPLWLVVTIVVFWHLIITTILSLVSWVMVRLVKKTPSKFFHLFIPVFIIGILGLLPGLISGFWQNHFSLLIAFYIVGLSFGVMAGLFYSIKKLDHQIR